jgi:hypothetical protein
MAEKAGIPAIGVMTTRFVSAAKLMSRVLGMPDYAFVVIEHPISSASNADLERAARSTLEQARTLLLRA